MRIDPAVGTLSVLTKVSGPNSMVFHYPMPLDPSVTKTLGLEATLANAPVALTPKHRCRRVAVGASECRRPAKRRQQTPNDIPIDSLRRVAPSFRDRTAHQCSITARESNP